MIKNATRPTTAKINRAIKHLNLEIIHQRGSGYSYFLDLQSGNQIGDSVWVCYLHQLSIDRWVSQAEAAREPMWFPIPVR